MQKEIIINASDNLQRVAIVEDGKLAELFVESEEKERMVGDVFLGTVAKVMPGIQASFINIGLDQDAFLHYSDVSDTFRQLRPEAPEKHGPAAVIVDDGQVRPTEEKADNRPDSKPQRYRRRPPSQVTLARGQELVVQIFKEPVGSKGVRVTTEIALPGRFLVLMPYDDLVGVSRKIQSFKEKRRLRRIVRSMLPGRFGVIIRTVAEGKAEEILRADLESLLITWRDIERNMKKAHAPTLLYKDMNSSTSTIRDLFSEEVRRVAVDSRRMYREIRAYLNLVAPHKVDVLEYHGKGEPIFDTYGIEKQIEQSMSRKVWLKSGGYIIIEHTEAMKVIDVNSGRYAAKREQELNSMRTNIEAAREIAHQIRLRDLGGIIVIDFIDMDQEENRRKLYEEMRREMRRDRAKYTILPVTEFGLIQITRQRERESVQMSVSESCPTCQGTGRVLSKSSLLTQIERWLRRFRVRSRELRLTILVHPVMEAFLAQGAISQSGRLMLKYFIRLKIVPDHTLAVDEFRVISTRRGKDVTKEFEE